MGLPSRKRDTSPNSDDDQVDDLMDQLYDDDGEEDLLYADDNDNGPDEEEDNTSQVEPELEEDEEPEPEPAPTRPRQRRPRPQQSQRPRSSSRGNQPNKSHGGIDRSGSRRRRRPVEPDDYEDEDDYQEEYEYDDNNEAMAQQVYNRSKQSIRNRQRADSREVRRAHSQSSEFNDVGKVKDAKKKIRNTRILAIIFAVAIMALSVWNVVIPKKQFTANDAEVVARQVSGDTGFPTEEGKGIVQQFMQAYLQFNGSPAASQLMGVFYNGMTYENAAKQTGTGNQPNNFEAPSSIHQVIQYGPYVYEAKPVDGKGTTATYKVGAIVYRTDANNNNAPILGADGKTPLYRQVFYEVDLHYNKKTGKFSVFKSSPTMVSPPAVEQPEAAPQADLPGNGQEAQNMVNEKTQQLITQFFQAWGDSDKSALSVVTNSSSTLDARKGGLGGAVKINGDPSYHMYEPPTTDHYYRALVTVQWVEKVTDQTTFTQTSQYVLKIEKDAKSMYVHDVQPYYYTPVKDAKN